jgi:hypothetical protein
MPERRKIHRLAWGVAALASATSLLVACSGSDGGEDATGTSAPAAAPDVDRVLSAGDDDVVADLDERFQSYNVEMVEVTGGQFWSPYDAGDARVTRPPIDLSSERLRNLARALGPAYIRVSGTWANSTYFDVDGTSGGVAPDGFGGVLTTEQWDGVGEFADAVGGQIVTSFASNTGVRDADGVWLDDQARALLQFSLDNDIPLVAAEFYNEPSLNIGAPPGYDAAGFARDFARFDAMAAEVMPDLRIVGPGAVEDVTPLLIDPAIEATDMLEAVGSSLDVFSYHFYPKVSERCGSTEGPEIALTREYLSRVEADKAYYENLRDTYVPDAPMWVTETAQAACGGDRWASTYRDVVRYVDELGRLADGDGNAVFHNTLAASDYGLIDEEGFEPRPNYWAAVLWRELMGPTVLAVDDTSTVPDLAVYAHCTPDASEPSITYAVVNSSATEARAVATTSGGATVYLLTGETLDGDTVALNGDVLLAAEDGTLPALEGTPTEGAVTVPPASVAFVVEPTAAEACAPGP